MTICLLRLKRKKSVRKFYDRIYIQINAFVFDPISYSTIIYYKLRFVLYTLLINLVKWIYILLFFYYSCIQNTFTEIVPRMMFNC